MERYSEPLLVEIDGAHSYIHVVVTTPKRPRRSILLVHDIAGRSEDFDPIVPHLLRMGFKVIVVDLPGRGRSAKIEPNLYNVRTYVSVLHAVLRTHGMQDCWLLGQGLGGMLAIFLDGLTSHEFAGIVTCDLPERWSYATDPEAQVWSRLSRIETDTDEDFIAEVDRHLPPEDPALQHIRGLALTRARGVGGKTRISVDPAIFDALGSTPGRVYDFRPVLKRLRSPLVLVESEALRSGQGRAAPVAPEGKKIDRLPVDASVNVPWTHFGLSMPVLGYLFVSCPPLRRAKPPATETG